MVQKTVSRSRHSASIVSQSDGLLDVQALGNVAGGCSRGFSDGSRGLYYKTLRITEKEKIFSVNISP